MKIFATRVWGYDPDTWPLVTFSGEAIANTLLRASSAEDVVVFVGTLGEPTAPRDQGRLLGFCQFGRYLVNTLEVLQKENLRPEHYENDVFKWPKALVMTRAWVFDDDPQPELKKVFEKQLPMNAMSQAVRLSEYDSEVVRNLKSTEVEIPQSEKLKKVQNLNLALSSGRPTHGIMPSAWSSMIGRKIGKPSVTYALRFGETNCWKIGYCTDIKRRLSEINKHIPHETIGQEWKVAYQQAWPDEVLAYEMEQKALSLLSSFRTVGERLTCSRNELERVWFSAITG